MRRKVPVLLLSLTALALACSDDDPPGLSPEQQYSLQGAPPSIEVGQDSSFQLVLTVTRGATALSGALVTYRSDDYSVANVSSTGVVTGLKGGSTVIRVSSNGATLAIPVTVRGHPATDVQLSFVDGSTTGTFFAMPGDEASSVLDAVVRAGTDTVFCNRCPDADDRSQRIVRFVSLDTTRATVSNAEDPAEPDESGRVLALDTTRATEPLRIVLEVPGDGLADTVLVNLRLRPIDSLLVRPDSFVNPLTGNRVAFANTVTPVGQELILGVTYWSRVAGPPPFVGAPTPGPRWIRVLPTGNLRRSSLPLVTWESANVDYASITADGRVVGLRANAQSAGQVLNCTNSPTIPAAFPGEGTLTIPNCSPTRTIPRPGVWCTTQLSTDANASCEVWIRATIRDPVSGLTRTDRIAVVVRR